MFKIKTKLIRLFLIFSVLKTLLAAECKAGQFQAFFSDDCVTKDTCTGTLGNYYKVLYDNAYEINYKLECEKTACDPPETGYNLIIYDTNECINTGNPECPNNYYFFRNKCFSNGCPENSEVKENASGAKTCVCKYKELEEGCLKENQSCPSPTNYFITGESPQTCIAEAGCPTSSLFRKYLNKDGNVDYECFDTGCYSYEAKFLDPVDHKTYCVTECPQGYFLDLTVNPKTCVLNENSCASGSFINFKTRKCVASETDCGSPYFINSGTSHYCVNYWEENPAFQSFPYLDGNEYKSSCTTVYSGPSVQDPSKIVNLCVISCSEFPLKPYIKDGKCVSECLHFSYKGKCYDHLYVDSTPPKTCYDVYATIKAESGSDDEPELMLSGTTECISSDECTTLIGGETDSTNHLCIKKCDEYIKSNTCVPCTGPLEKTVYGQKICYDNCPKEYPYSRKDGKECFASDKGCKGILDGTYKYFDSSDYYTCYKSCSDHVKFNDFSLITEDFECLNNVDTPSEMNCPAPYFFKYGKKCLRHGCPEGTILTQFSRTSDPLNLTCIQENECSNNYIEEKSCVTTCDTKLYPFFIEKTDESPGYCLKTLEECYERGYIYFQIDGSTNFRTECLKTCTKSIELDTLTGKPTFRKEGTCVTTCPGDYPYSYENFCYKDGCPNSKTNQLYMNYLDTVTTTERSCLTKTECITNGFINEDRCITSCSSVGKLTDDVNKVCIEKGKCGINQFILNGNCASTCDNFGSGGTKNYYNPKTHECVESCINENDFPYTPIPGSSGEAPKACLEKCPGNQFYFSLNKACKETCDYPSSDTTNPQLCLYICQNDEKFDERTNRCVTDCDKGFFYPKTMTVVTSDLIDGLSGSITRIIYSCTEKCDTTHGGEFAIFKSRQCVSECTPQDNYIYENMCYEKCPDEAPYFECLNDADHHCNCYKDCSETSGKATKTLFHFKSQFECKESCPSDYNFLLSESSKECMSECPPDYSLVAITEKDIDGKKFNICSDMCIGTQVSVDGICKDTCGSDNYKMFLDPRKSECLETFAECQSRGYRFYKKTLTYYTCLTNCSTYSTEYGECFGKPTDCPSGLKFIGKDNICKASCDKNIDGEYYLKVTTSETDPIYYQCLKSCVGYYYIDVFDQLSKECLFECPHDNPDSGSPTTYYYYEAFNKKKGTACRQKCYEADEDMLIFSYEGSDNKKYCKAKCDSDKKNFGPDRICQDGCNDPYYPIENYDGECVNKCEGKFKYLSYDKTQCLDICPSGRYILPDYWCVPECPKPNNFLLPSGECAPKCDQTNKNAMFAYSEDTTPTEYICQRSCEGSKLNYFDSDKICIEDCESKNGFLVEGTNLCVRNCTEQPISKYTFDGKKCVAECSETSKKFTSPDGRCQENCKISTTSIYYIESDKICLPDCPSSDYFKKIVTADGIECLNNCPISGTPYLDDEGKCVTSCSNDPHGYIFFKPEERICLNECPENYFIYKDVTDPSNPLFKCVKQCPTEMPYVLGKRCVDKCTEGTMIFFIEKIQHGEKITHHVCLTDCPQEYPYYYTVNNGGVNYNYCTANCPSSPTNYKKFSLSEDPKMIRKKCLTDCSADDYIYTLNDECFKKCPQGFDYYIGTVSNIQCYKQCPPFKPNHFLNSFECVGECDPGSEAKYFDSVTSTCLKEEPRHYRYYLPKTSPMTYVEKCNATIGKYETYRRECVKSCEDVNFDKVGSEIDHRYYKAKESGDKFSCECQGFYYINNDGITMCLDPFSVRDCTQAKDKDDRLYPYLKEGTKQCLDRCQTLISTDSICLNNLVCKNPALEEIKLTPAFFTGDTEISYRRCHCKFAFYKSDDELKDFCLKENEICPLGKDYYNVETHECRSSCSDDEHTLGNFCADSDLFADVKAGNKAWYQISPFEAKILSNTICDPDHPYKIVSNFNQCVENCKSSKFSILKGNECVVNCEVDSKYTGKTVPIASELSSVADFACECGAIWYYKDITSGLICLEDKTKDTCQTAISNPKYQYLVKSTKQCVEKCEGEYKFIFNSECYKSCDEAGMAYHINLIESGNTCECPNLWKKYYNTTSNRVEKHCVSVNYCKTDEAGTYKLIASTKECLPATVCPQEFPVEFNDGCYTKENVPDNTKYDNSLKEAFVCKNLWYLETIIDETFTLERIHCLDESIIECPTEKYIYHKVDTKECSSEEPSTTDYVKFNQKYYYKNCPPVTIKNGNDCICDKKFGRWNKYEKNGDDFFNCAQGDKCPSDKKFFIEESGECVFTCQYAKAIIDGSETDLQFSFGDKCYKECPIDTIHDEGSYDCYYQGLEKAKDLEELNKLVDEDILKIYTESQTGGFIFDKFQTTLQIYSINNKDEFNEKLVMKNNLTMIHFNSCIQNIFKENDLSESDKIIVAKYDMYGGKPELTDYLINTVEYKFYSSKTGKEIDISVCKDTEISISYPIKYYLDEHYNPYFNETKVKKLTNLYFISKEFYNKNNQIDILNYKSPMYNDICIPLEIEGKDITIQDRREKLYPNVTICENNCTPSYIDYEAARIHCQCPIKNFLDFERQNKPETHDFSEGDTKALQRGPTNFPAIKCIGNLKSYFEQSVTNNVAFYFSTILVVSEVILILLTSFYSIGNLTAKLKKKFSNIGNNNLSEEFSETKEDISNENKKFKVTRRNLHINVASNPPKKDYGSSHDDESFDDKSIKNSNEANDKRDLQKKEETNDVADFLTIKGQPKKDNINYQDKSNIGESEIENEEERSEKPDEEFEEEKTLLNKIRFAKGMFIKSFKDSLRYDNSSLPVIIIAEILDKIYLSKSIVFFGKYDLVSLLISLYILYHIVLLTLMTSFFNVNIISKIYIEEHFPNAGFYILYGFIALIIMWFFYKLMLCLVKNEETISRYNQKIKRDIFLNKNKEYIEERIESLNSIIKSKTISFIVIEIILVAFCFIYILGFSAIYTGTRKYVFYSYGFALCVISVVKVFYGIILGVLRYLSLKKRIKYLYEAIKIFNIYFD